MATTNLTSKAANKAAREIVNALAAEVVAGAEGMMTEVTVTIPGGKYCGECILLNTDYHCEPTYICIYLAKAIYQLESSPNATKHPDCPGLKRVTEKVPA